MVYFVFGSEEEREMYRKYVDESGTMAIVKGDGGIESSPEDILVHIGYANGLQAVRLVLSVDM